MLVYWWVNSEIPTLNRAGSNLSGRNMDCFSVFLPGGKSGSIDDS